ncbi:uncharacterized protein [Blastocystis hominis]|uniref:peptide-methionine (S)-S-oxide reductase n=1 Tax=Blastocystis hominis TaxID=12968 RepID=D8M7H8_BLAHO|nr:uncharacterized protein [Blastocystis hominis]CBK24017.2 unnamed protein product [Blastocystis hominis]|eukprot:XP_012898065.1 uncharacterized protein [Blastocystis hominis]
MSLSRIVIGMNSFRCSEALIGGLFGVQFTRIGYAGDYTEVVEANYNKSIISLSEILQLFFENHDYSVVYPKRYASVIYYTEEEQREESEYYMKQYLSGDVATELKPLTNYIDAEHMYHKYYLQNTPTMMLQLLHEYNWDIRTLNACLSGFYDTEYVAKILDSINVPDNIKLECKLRASRALPQCILL